MLVSNRNLDISTDSNLYLQKDGIVSPKGSDDSFTCPTLVGNELEIHPYRKGWLVLDITGAR